MVEHTILCQSTCLVAQQVLNATQVFWDCASPNDSAFDAFIMLYEPCIDRLAHIEIDTQTYWDNSGEQNEESQH